MKLFSTSILVLSLLSLASFVNSEEASKPVKRKVPTTVELTIDFGDGAQKRFPAIPWKDKMTVFEALLWAGKHPHGVQVKHRGKDSLALVGQIDDLKNSGGSGKNWIFYVNEKLADRGCGASKVRAGDKILWRFEVYR